MACDNESSTQSRVLSRSTLKKELKAFPKEEEEGKILNEEVAVSWDEEDESQEKSASVWEERQKTRIGNVWNVSSEEGKEGSSERYFEDKYQAERHSKQYVPRRRPSYEDSDVDILREDRRVIGDDDERANLPSSYIQNLPQVKIAEQPKIKQITIQQKPKVEILQKPAIPRPGSVQSVGAPSGNYWKEKQAERDKKEADEDRKKQEEEKGDAQRKREEQYQDYRHPDQYSGSAFDEDQVREYEDEREKRSIRRRGHDEFYDNDAHNDRSERPTRRSTTTTTTRRRREEVFRIDYKEPREDVSTQDSRNSRDTRDHRRLREKRVYSSEEKRNTHHQPRGSREGDRLDSRERRLGLRHDDRRSESRRKNGSYEDAGRFKYERHDEQGCSKGIDRSRKSKSEEKEISVEETLTHSVPESTSSQKKDSVNEFADDQVSEEELDNQNEIIESDSKEEQLPTPLQTDRYTRKRRDPQERYEKERYENPNFTTYRREPRSSRRERSSEFRREQTKRDRRPKQREQESKDSDNSVKTEEKKPISAQKARIEKYKAGLKEMQSRPERPTRHPREEQEWVQSEKQPPKYVSRSKSCYSADQQTAETSEKQETSSRRSRKLPSLRYYSANPADRLKSSQPFPTRISSSEDKQKDKIVKPKTNTRHKESKKDTLKKETTESKTSETSTKNKTKDSGIDTKKLKKVDNTKFEMDRLKKMSQAGMDLLTLGIYAVDGKELDELEADDFSEGFVEVVRKKNKKEAEPEKKATTKSKKTKKSSASKGKKAVTAQDELKSTVSSNTSTVAAATSPTEKAAVKPWVAGAPSVDVTLMSNIWSNTKKNAWEKPLTFTEKQSMDTRDILAPISGESSSLFSSDADLARKTKEKNWRGSFI